MIIKYSITKEVSNPGKYFIRKKNSVYTGIVLTAAKINSLQCVFEELIMLRSGGQTKTSQGLQLTSQGQRHPLPPAQEVITGLSVNHISFCLLEKSAEMCYKK